MPNRDSPSGFVPSRHMAGGTVRTNEYNINASAGTFGVGDMLKLLTSGDVDIAAAGDTNLVGPCDGVFWTAADGSYQFAKRWVTGTSVLAGTSPKALVWDDPNILFRCQTVSGTNFTQAMVGANCDIVVSAAPASTGRSGSEANIASLSTTTANLRLYGLINDPENAVGEHADIEVYILEHIHRPANAVLGI